MTTKALMWFRRDLRLADNAAVYHALKNHAIVYSVFIFDKAILDDLLPNDARVGFIHEAICELSDALKQQGSGLIIRYDYAHQAIPKLAKTLQVNAVYANHDYEPYAKARDDKVQSALMANGITFHTSKDQVIFEKNEILTEKRTPYNIFTPYKNAWLKKVSEKGGFFIRSYPTEKYFSHFAKRAINEGETPMNPQDLTVPNLSTMGFQPSPMRDKPMGGASYAKVRWQNFQDNLCHYHEWRDFPAQNATSRLSVDLRFGTIAIRELAAHALMLAKGEGSKGAEVWLSELIWRDFYCMILEHFPSVQKGNFRPEYDAIEWDESELGERHFLAWCRGETGYPIVDAAMQQLNSTGFMHNRLRMVVASFLTKDLGIDWRRGEAYFAQQLLDFDLSANNGGWQWSASTGCDAQPWFRIFNPITQSEKFDAEGQFIRHYLPILAKVPTTCIHAPWQMILPQQLAANVVIGKDYPMPIVDHARAREATLVRYGRVKKREDKPIRQSNTPNSLF